MGTPEPDPTELDFFGAPGVLLTLGAMAGILHALVQFFAWITS